MEIDELDDLDKQIINLVQNGDVCGPKINKISKVLQKPSSTIHSRIKRLEDEGFIKGYSALVDSEKLGKSLTMFALIKLKYPETEEDFEFDENLGKRIAFSDPLIQEVHTMTGEWELLVKIKASDKEEYYKVAREGIIKTASGRVLKVNGLITLSTLKEEHKIPV